MKTTKCYAGGRPTTTKEARILILLDELKAEFEILTTENHGLRKQYEKLLFQRKALEGK